MWGWGGGGEYHNLQALILMIMQAQLCSYAQSDMDNRLYKLYIYDNRIPVYSGLVVVLVAVHLELDSVDQCVLSFYVSGIVSSVAFLVGVCVFAAIFAHGQLEILMPRYKNKKGISRQNNNKNASKKRRKKRGGGGGCR